MRGATASLRAAVRTAMFVLKILPNTPHHIDKRLSPRPLVEHVRYPSRFGPTDGDLYKPHGAGPHPGVVVCPGAVPVGVDYEQVSRLMTALTASGFAALLHWSPAMRNF